MTLFFICVLPIVLSQEGTDFLVFDKTLSQQNFSLQIYNGSKLRADIRQLPIVFSYFRGTLLHMSLQSEKSLWYFLLH